MFAILFSGLLMADTAVKQATPEEPKGPQPYLVHAWVKEDLLVAVGTGASTGYDNQLFRYLFVQTWDLKKATITTAGGKKLTSEELAKLLVKPRLVAVSQDGKPVDPVYLKLLDRETIVIAAPRAVPKDTTPLVLNGWLEKDLLMERRTIIRQ